MKIKQTNNRLNFIAAFVLSVGLLLWLTESSDAQSCTGYPNYSWNLVGHPDTSFSSGTLTRGSGGTCCSNSGNCLQLILTLDPATIAIGISVNGAQANGAFTEVVDCGTPYNGANNLICVAGGGTHYISICKPGNNTYNYTISTISGPSFPSNDTVRVGCSKDITVKGLLQSSITWNSVFPGASGAYNSYLNCTSNCSTTLFSPQTGAPAYIDYQICGTPGAAGCGASATICDTVRMYVIPKVTVSVSPLQAQIDCKVSSVTLTATASAGTTLLWSPGGQTTASITASAQGTYTVTATSTAYGCTSTASASAVVNQNFAGPNLSCGQGSVCLQTNSTLVCANAGQGVTFDWSGPGIVGSNTGACINVNASGNYTVIATKTSSGCTQSCAIAVSTPNLNVGPTVYLFCNITSAKLCATASTGTIFVWSGPGIVGSNTGACITANQAGIYTVVATTPSGCSQSGTIELKVLTSNTNCDEHCTRTQGYYGSGGKLCDGRTALQAITDLLNQGPLVVGSGSRTITFLNTDAACLNSKMPAGTTPAVLPVGNDTCPQATGNKYLKNGRFISVLLGQTIAMSLNVRLDPTLGALALTGPYLTTFAADSCVNGVPVPNTGKVFIIPQNVLDYLGTANTVNDLLALADSALGKTYNPNNNTPSLSDINAALDALNNAFDECRIFISFSSVPPFRVQGNVANESGLNVFPNPFSDHTTIEMTANGDYTNASVDIFSVTGAKVKSLYKGNLKDGETYRWDLNGKDLARGVYIYRITAGDQLFQGKLVLINQ